MDTLLFLYLKQKNTCKDTAIGAVSQQLAWKERVQSKIITAYNHLTPICHFLSKRKRWHKNYFLFWKSFEVSYVWFVSEPSCSFITQPTQRSISFSQRISKNLLFQAG